MRLGAFYTRSIMINSNILTAQFPDGSVATIGSGAGIDGPGMEYDDTNGILYVISSDSTLYTVSTVNGTSNLIGPTGLHANSFKYRAGLR